MLRIFHHYIPTSIVLLIVIEFIILYSSVYIGVEIRAQMDGFSDIMWSLRPLPSKALLFTIIFGLSMTAMGLHTRYVVDDFAGIVIRILLSFGFGFLVSTVVFYMLPDLFLGRGVFGLAMLVAFISILLTRTIYQNLDNNQIFRRRVLVLGTGNQANLLNRMMADINKRGHEIVGFVRVDKSESKIPEEQQLEIKNTILDLALNNDIDEIVLAMDDRRKGFPVSGLLECKMKGIFVRDIIHFLERITGHIELNVLHPSTMIFSSGFTAAVSPNGAKRMFDVIVSLVILVIASPVIILTAISIWLSSIGRDPVFYRQTRIGLCNKPFNVLKFRSMKTDAEKNGAQFASKKDSRITMIGAFIRKTRIDELPQLLNVLKGEMSFVGPRPERPEFVLSFEQSIRHYALRHSVKPGITGWAQICYPYGDNIEDTRNKLQYDLYYIKNYSLFLDFTILLQTMQVVIFGQGAR